MKTIELRSKTIQELNNELLALLREQFNMRMERYPGSPAETKSTGAVKRVRRDIARIKTILHQRATEL